MPMAYQYEGDRFCRACTRSRFNLDANGDPMADAIDREGNPVTAIYSDTMWCEGYGCEGETLHCARCYRYIDDCPHLVRCDDCSCRCINCACDIERCYGCGCGSNECSDCDCRCDGCDCCDMDGCGDCGCGQPEDDPYEGDDECTCEACEDARSWSPDAPPTF